MPYLHEFSEDDIFSNRMITHPSYKFQLYSGSAYINNDRANMGINIPTGSISLYEYNVNRDVAAGNELIYPFLIKDGSGLAFPNVTREAYNELAPGTVIQGSYPLTSSLARQYFAATTDPFANNGTDTEKDAYVDARKNLISLKNTMNYYRYLSDDYEFDSTYTENVVNLITIPSIFYDAGIEKGSVKLDFYFTGSLIASATDERRNGELIATRGTTSGSTIGVVLYNEGFILLTNTTALATQVDNYLGESERGSLAKSQDNPRWTYFGAYANKYVGGSKTTYASASLFDLSFKGTNKVPTMSMFATAQPGDLNNSLNPTWISSSEVNSPWRNRTTFTSGAYIEPNDIALVNTVQSQYCYYQDEFAKQTFVTKIGLYDKDRNLIGVAKVANPVLKKEQEDFTFKLKMDF